MIKLDKEQAELLVRIKKNGVRKTLMEDDCREVKKMKLKDIIDIIETTNEIVEAVYK